MNQLAKDEMFSVKRFSCSVNIAKHNISKTLRYLKAKKPHGFNSCIVISVYILDILSIEKATEYRNY